MPPSLLVLDNPIQNYAWGSRTAIAEMLGRPHPSPLPEAELWMGAHPKAPSRVVEPLGVGSLDRAIARDPVAMLGRQACDRFGNELPFLFKVLAADEPLSIQAHPDQEHARAGWTRENAQGVPLDAPHRNYRDPNHKPELVCALSPFVALEGFRPAAEIATNLAPVAGEELGAAVDRAGHEASPASLRALLARLLTLDDEERARLLPRAAATARRRGDEAWQWVGRLVARFPGDPGALAPLYLNLVTLAPGEALFLPSGVLHAYLGGTALEIMANSDNVLRGGLTAKHVDVPELLETLVFEPHDPRPLTATEVASGERRFETPAAEFELGLLEVSARHPFAAGRARGAEILLGLEGQVSVTAGKRATPLGRGRSVFVPASLAAYVLEGSGRVARARVP